uniref:Uncharacterized protein n=1 Tax=Octopus bimaculoides TaxID=37653 RepID=A0A0L8GIB0_OCTBM
MVPISWCSHDPKSHAIIKTSVVWIVVISLLLHTCDPTVDCHCCNPNILSYN